MVNAARAALAVGRTEDAMALLKVSGNGAGNAGSVRLGVTHLMAVQRFKPEMNRTEQALPRLGEASIRHSSSAGSTAADLGGGVQHRAHYLGANMRPRPTASRGQPMGHDVTAHLCGDGIRR